MGCGSDRIYEVTAPSDLGSYVREDAHPPEEWRDCPNCNERLHAQATITDAADDIVGVEYACTGPDHWGALWVWETATDELHYRGNSEVLDPFDGDE